MAFAGSRHFSREIIEAGYDIAKKTLVVTLTDRIRRSYAPAPYDMYAALTRSAFPLRLFRERIAGKVPLIATSRYP